MWMSAFIRTIAAYRRSGGGRFGVFVECEHPSVENRPRLGPVFPETLEWPQKKMTRDAEHTQEHVRPA